MIENRFNSQSLCDSLVFEIKPTIEADCSIWEDAFGDSLSEIKGALDQLKSCSFCASLTKNDTVLSQFIGLETIFNEKKGVYVYALCTNTSYRNKGYMRRLLELSFEYGKEVGYDYFWLFPASEDLKKSYNKLGFTVEIPVGASPFPTEENDFYNVACFNNCDKELFFSSFDGDYRKLYSLSDKIFDYDAFKYSLSAIADSIEIKYIEQHKKATGYIIVSKAYPDKALCVSADYAYLIKSSKKESAYLYPLSVLNYNDIRSAEPLPR